MKAKSVKLRFLITLQAILKHSDEKHRMNTVKINEYLKPYGLDCTGRVLGDTVQAMKDFGFDVKSKGKWGNHGIWTENVLLSDDAIDRLAFAVSTNPYLSNTECGQIMASLRSFVTVHQESLLENYTKKQHIPDSEDTLYCRCRVIRDAISREKRVRFAVPRICCDQNNHSLKFTHGRSVLFTPGYLYQQDDSLYMAGYNHNRKAVDIVDLKEVCGLKITTRNNRKNAREIRDIIDNVRNMPMPQKEKNNCPVLYKGDMVFKCSSICLGKLHEIFGPPSSPLKRDRCYKYTYTVTDASLDTVTLNQIADMPKRSVRIMGPDNLLGLIHEYYQETATTLAGRIARKKKG